MVYFVKIEKKLTYQIYEFGFKFHVDKLGANDFIKKIDIDQKNSKNIVK